MQRSYPLHDEPTAKLSSDQRIYFVTVTKVLSDMIYNFITSHVWDIFPYDELCNRKLTILLMTETLCTLYVTLRMLYVTLCECMVEFLL